MASLIKSRIMTNTSSCLLFGVFIMESSPQILPTQKVFTPADAWKFNILLFYLAHKLPEFCYLTHCYWHYELALQIWSLRAITKMTKDKNGENQWYILILKRKSKYFQGQHSGTVLGGAWFKFTNWPGFACLPVSAWALSVRGYTN